VPYPALNKKITAIKISLRDIEPAVFMQANVNKKSKNIAVQIPIQQITFG
jgi:hypothetical protein